MNAPTHHAIREEKGGKPVDGRYRYRGIRIERNDATPPGYWGHWQTLDRVLKTYDGRSVVERASTKKRLLLCIDNILDAAEAAQANNIAAQQRTTVGDFQIWFSPEHQNLRMARSSEPTAEFEFEVEAFTRSERSTAHEVFMAGKHPAA